MAQEWAWEATFEQDLMLRCARAGLRHLYLGHLRAGVSAEGLSASLVSPADSARLRQSYPDSSFSSAFTLERRRVGAGRQSAIPYSLEELQLLAAAALGQTSHDDEIQRSVLEAVAGLTHVSGELVTALENLQTITKAL